MDKSAPWKHWKTLLICHSPTGQRTINYYSESGSISAKTIIGVIPAGAVEPVQGFPVRSGLQQGLDHARDLS